MSTKSKVREVIQRLQGKPNRPEFYKALRKLGFERLGHGCCPFLFRRQNYQQSIDIEFWWNHVDGHQLTYAHRREDSEWDALTFRTLDEMYGAIARSELALNAITLRYKRKSCRKKTQ